MSLTIKMIHFMANNEIYTVTVHLYGITKSSVYILSLLPHAVLLEYTKLYSLAALIANVTCMPACE